MSPLATVLILATLPAASMVGRDPDAVTVFHCDFTDSWDVNFDGWPDHWKRARGLPYPSYLEIAVRDEPSPVGNRCLRINLDGGAAAVYSPPIRVHPQFSYVLEGFLKTERLQHDVAYYSVAFMDEHQNRLSSHRSPPLRDATQWRRIRLGPLIPPDAQARFAVVGLHLRPEAEEADLQGAALFDDVWLARVPQVSLHTGSRHNVYTELGNVEITCQVSGVVEPNPEIRFALLDVAGQQVDQWQTRLAGQPQSPAPDAGPRGAPHLVDSSRPPWANTQAQPQTAYVGSVSWKPSLPGNGFYRVRATMQGSGGSQRRQTISLVVIDPVVNRSAGEFGWSLPQGEHPLPIRTLVGLLIHAGISWVKFPVWFSDHDPELAERLAWFAERLSNDEIELVGVLDQPPPDARKRFGEATRLPAAAVFAEPAVWQPVLDPVMTRLSLKVQWWQLGTDMDTSYVDYPNLPAKIQEVKGHLRRFGQSIRLGIGWHWINGTPAPGDAPWDFLSLSATPPLTSEELKTYLDGDAYGRAERWVVLQPLSSSQYDVRTRAHDLVVRMLAAKVGGAKRMFLPEPFSPEHGVMNPDGTPGELLLPWRTTALMISGTQRIGSLSLPHGSQNEVLVRGDTAVMVVWNQNPVDEVIYLGEDVRQVDLWGRQTQPASDQGRQVIRVGPLPSFVTGLNPAIARWRLSFKFDNDRISSVVGRPQTISYQVSNSFPQGVSGQVRLDTPEVWGPPPAPLRFKLAATEPLSTSFSVTLRGDASSGRQNIRINFDVAADQRYQFSVYRTMDVGLGNISIELSAHVNRDNELVVQQRMINQSEQFVSFNCYLFAPNRRRLRHQVFELGRGTDKRIFVLPRGDQLKGKMIWLRAEEIGGDRVLNYRLKVED